MSSEARRNAGGSEKGKRNDISDLVDDIDAVVWEADPRTFAFTYVSKGAERLLGFPVAQWLREPDFWARHIHPEDRSTAVALCQSATSSGRDHVFEYRMIAADGSIRWVRDLVRVWTDKSGAAVRLRGVLFDKTASKRAEEARRESEQRFRAVFESMSAGIVLLTLDGRIISSNRAAAAMLGYTSPELSQRSLPELADPEERAQMRRIVKSLAWRSQNPAEHEARFTHKHGHTITTLLSGAVIPQPEIGPAYIVAQMLDVSVRKTLELELQQARKLEAVGRLAGGVAHDFNNILTVIGSYVDFLAEGMHPSDPRRAELDEIRKAGVAGADLTRQLLALSRQQVIEPRIVELSSVVRSVHRMLQRLLDAKITIVTQFASKSANVRVDPGQLEQVIINLVVNARDAMPDGGTLTIQTSIVESAAAEDYPTPGRSRSRYSMLAVTDTGVGMDDATRRRIFEPFFTTKPSDKGTGLGLATVYGVVRQHDGFISVDSAPGVGTSFKVHFPLVELT